MPLKRTPPSDPKSKSNTPASTGATKEASPKHSSSKGHSPKPTDFISTRNKRKIPDNDDDDDLQSFMRNIKSMISNLAMTQEKKFSEVQGSLKALNEQNVEIVQSLSFLSEKYEELKDKVDILEKERNENIHYINSLENRLDFLERKARSSSIEIRNVPRTHAQESKLDLMDIATKIGSTLNISLMHSDFQDAYRTKSSSVEAPPIVVEFSSMRTKENILQTYKSFNKENKEERLSTTHLQLKTPGKIVYISELLTQKTKRLFYLARDFAKTNGYLFCWTQHGSVYMRKKEGLPPFKINSVEDLKKIPLVE